MPKQTKICRVCGASYEACRSIKTGDSVFNWREVACSPECGEIYLRQVMESRNHDAASSQKKKKHSAHVDTAPVVDGAADIPNASEDCTIESPFFVESPTDAADE